jgi:hypothetical protein
MSEPLLREEHDELGVEIVDEKWNTYILADHAQLKTRPILLKIFWPKNLQKVGPDTKVNLRVSYQQIIVPLISKELEGKPTLPLPPTPEALNMERENVKISRSEEDWNIYELPGGRGRVKVKMVVSDVVKIKGKYDENGCPLYLVNSSVVITPAL